MTDLDLDGAVRIARVLIDASGIEPAEAAANPAIPPDLRPAVLARLEAERVIHVRDPHIVVDPHRDHEPWLDAFDAETWYYWRRLREHLIDRPGGSDLIARSVDRATDRILGLMESPVRVGPFRTQGLVVGYVQSGKTANYSGLIAKAADAGYRLVIVLTGIHNSLRQQTQRRLTAELVGLDEGQSVGVGPPDSDRLWFTYTSSRLDGDFNPGNADATALSSGKPVLIVMKKWVSILTALLGWLDRTPPGTLATIPTLIIDDEADQASPNTGGDRSPDLEEDDLPAEETAPSSTNGLIRQLIGKFDHVAYVAYTATPFANVLIDPDAMDRVSGEDLYPHSFIVDLPKPPGYWGAERIFGLGEDGEPDPDEPGLDVIRRVPDEDVQFLVPERRADVEDFEPALPESLRQALDDFVLAAAARAQRGDGRDPATMLIHTSYRTAIQQRLHGEVDEAVQRLTDEWSYTKEQGLEARLRTRWEEDFLRVTRSVDQELAVPFDAIAEFIRPFLRQLEVRQINSGSLDELDYEREPELKAVVIGGNRLSRGLTLEGLLVSYYVRAARNYDTLLQMARWFGYRDGYADLTRIYTTESLENWFRHLAMVELEVRADIERYELEGLTPTEFGVRIRTHPGMLVTSPLKSRRAVPVQVSFSDSLRQTINFPFRDGEFLRSNLEATRGFLAALGPPHAQTRTGQPLWRDVPADIVLEFLSEYAMDETAAEMQSIPITNYIRRQNQHGELTKWVVAVMGQADPQDRLGPQVDVGVPGQLINPIERRRIRDTATLKAIASQPDAGVGLSDEQLAEARARGAGYGRHLRHVRDPAEGVLLVYPISRYSGHGPGEGRIETESRGEAPGLRVPIFSDPDQGVDVIGIGIVFPPSESAATREYIQGPAGLEAE